MKKLLICLVLLMMSLPAWAQDGVGFAVGSSDRCDGVDVRFKVDPNVPYKIRLFNREGSFSYGEISGTGSGDPYVEKNVFIAYSTFPKVGQTVFVEMFIHNFTTPATVIEQTVTCANPGANAERGVRIVANPKFVVFLMPDFSLEYYEVLDSKGYAIGSTPPGWRNDALGRQQIHTVSNSVGSRAELWHLNGETYYVDIYRNEGLVGTGTFLALGVPSGQGVVVSTGSNVTATPATTTTTVTTTTTTTITVGNDTNNRRDNGAGYRAQGTFDGTFYTVVAGDNLFRIALRFNTTLNAILAVNSNITDPTRIEVGQRIQIP